MSEKVGTAIENLEHVMIHFENHGVDFSYNHYASFYLATLIHTICIDAKL